MRRGPPPERGQNFSAVTLPQVEKSAIGSQNPGQETAGNNALIKYLIKFLTRRPVLLYRMRTGSKESRKDEDFLLISIGTWESKSR